MTTAPRGNGAPAFTNEKLNGATPWFGPILGRGFRGVLSSPCLQLPRGETFGCTVWVFDESGAIVAGKDLAECRHGEPVQVDLERELGVSRDVKGMVAALLRPRGDTPAPPPDAWTVRFIGPHGFEETVVSEPPPQINASGSSSTFKMVSSQVYVGDGWRPILAVCNASCDAEYDRTMQLSISVHNGSGGHMEAPVVAVPPFGTAWIDLVEVFGPAINSLLESSGGRGSVHGRSLDAAAVGYHFLFHPELGHLAGDHTRPMLRYISTGYGTSKYSTDRSTLFAAKSVGHFAYTRLTKGVRR